MTTTHDAIVQSGTSPSPPTCSNMFTRDLLPPLDLFKLVHLDPHLPTRWQAGGWPLPTEFAFNSAFFKLRRICGDTVCVRHKNCIARMIGHAQHQHWETTFSRLLAAVRNSIFYTFLYLNLKRVISLYHPPVQRRVGNVFNRVCLSVYLSTGKVLM